jgi:hypothetical protein
MGNVQMETRTNKAFKNLTSFSEEIIVLCPNCQKRAMVSTTLGKYTVPYPSEYSATFSCNNCYKPLPQAEWKGPINVIVSSPCGKCGSRIEHVVERTSDYKKQLKVKCNVCSDERFYETQHELTYANNNQATDPYFGLQLWLQIPIKNNTFWAYNFEHLEYLRQYVSAKLREAASGGKYSLAWKLPKFIKDGKNKERILKAVSKLEFKK